MAAVTAAVVAGGSALAGAYGARQQRKAAEEQARAASQPTHYERTTTSDPWGPSTGYRKYGMKRAKGLLSGKVPGGSGSYSPSGYSAKGYSAQEAGESPYSKEAAEYWRKFAKGEGSPHISDYIGQLMPGEGKQYQGNPYLDQIVEASLRGTEDRYKQGLAGLALGAESTGRYGGGAHQLASAKASTDFGNVLSDTESGLRYQDYNARMADLMGLLQMDQQGRLAGAGGLTGLSTQDQERIMFNMQAANEARARNAAARNAAAAANARARNAAAANNSMAGWRNLGAYSDIINAMSRGYGTTTEKGFNQGPQVAPAPTPDPWMSAVQGGLSGYQLGSALGGSNYYKPGSTVKAGWSPGQTVQGPTIRPTGSYY